jgi:hypothetical protein
MRVDGVRYLLDGGSPREVAVRAVRAYRRDRWLLSPRRHGRRVDAQPLVDPIFVLGVQGGGTTLIARALRRHPDVVAVSGGSDNWTGADELGVIRNRMRRLPPSLWGCKFRDDVSHPVLGSNHNSVFACDELLPFYRREPEQATEADRRAFTRLLREHLAVHRGRRFLDKTHTATVRVGYLARLLEGHRPHFVLVVRNPYSTCFRAVRRKPPSFAFVPPYERQLALAAEHWESSMRLALEDGLGSERFTVVRFEDFVARPEATVRRLALRVGLDFRPAMAPAPGQELPFATLASDRKWWPLEPDPWLGQLTPADVEIVAARCGPLAEYFGYEPPALGVPADAELRRLAEDEAARRGLAVEA